VQIAQTSYTGIALDPSKLPMRHTLTGLCIMAVLCVASASTANSSSAHKRAAIAHPHANAHATASRVSTRAATRAATRPAPTHIASNRVAAHPTAHVPTRNSAPDASRTVALRRGRSTSEPVANRRSIRKRNTTDVSAPPASVLPAKAMRNPSHKRMSLGQSRLERIRVDSRPSRHSLETETPGRSGLIDPPTQRRGRLPKIMPMPLRGSRESLIRQNERSENEGLERIEDDQDLNNRIASKALVLVPTSSALAINANLPLNRRYCRPWTAAFLRDLAQGHAAKFSSPLMVTSAVRTVEYQKQLRGVNANAAAAEGDIASPHLTGGSIDIGKQRMRGQEIAWLRTWLLALQQAGKIDVEEEFKQACFHITVYKTYIMPPPQRWTPRQGPPPTKAYSESGQIASAGQ